MVGRIAKVITSSSEPNQSLSVQPEQSVKLQLLYEQSPPESEEDKDDQTEQSSSSVELSFAADAAFPPSSFSTIRLRALPSNSASVESISARVPP